MFKFENFNAERVINKNSMLNDEEFLLSIFKINCDTLRIVDKILKKNGYRANDSIINIYTFEVDTAFNTVRKHLERTLFKEFDADSYVIVNKLVHLCILKHKGE